MTFHSFALLRTLSIAPDNAALFPCPRAILVSSCICLKRQHPRSCQSKLAAAGDEAVFSQTSANTTSAQGGGSNPQLFTHHGHKPGWTRPAAAATAQPAEEQHWLRSRPFPSPHKEGPGAAAVPSTSESLSPGAEPLLRR